MSGTPATFFAEEEVDHMLHENDVGVSIVLVPAPGMKKHTMDKRRKSSAFVARHIFMSRARKACDWNEGAVDASTRMFTESPVQDAATSEEMGKNSIAKRGRC